MRSEPYLLPDSKHGLWRIWCVRCGEPMRVTQADALGYRQHYDFKTVNDVTVPAIRYCEKCDPPHMPPGSPTYIKDETDPWQDNAIRQMEE